MNSTTLFALPALMLLAACDDGKSLNVTWQDVAMAVVIGLTIVGMSIADAIKGRKAR